MIQSGHDLIHNTGFLIQFDSQNIVNKFWVKKNWPKWQTMQNDVQFCLYKTK